MNREQLIADLTEENIKLRKALRDIQKLYVTNGLPFELESWTRHVYNQAGKIAAKALAPVEDLELPHGTQL